MLDRSFVARWLHANTEWFAAVARHAGLDGGRVAAMGTEIAAFFTQGTPLSREARDLAILMIQQDGEWESRVATQIGPLGLLSALPDIIIMREQRRLALRLLETT